MSQAKHDPVQDALAEMSDLSLEKHLQSPKTSMPTWMRAVIAILALYAFIASVKMIGTGLKTTVKDEAGQRVQTWLLDQVDDPLTGLFVGLLLTSMVQSSSFTTALTVGLVGDQILPLHAAIPIIMGANIGTSVTNILVSLAHVRRRLEFRRSLGGAIVHDFFNVLCVLLFMPLEMAFGIISRPVDFLHDKLAGLSFFKADPTESIGFIKQAFALPGKSLNSLMTETLSLPRTWGGLIVSVFAMVLLFLALWLLVKMLRGLMEDRLSGALSKTLFRNPPIAFLVGIVMTIAVQSSSVTTSLVVPLVGAGILKIRQIYPYTLGANIGTTITGLLAGLGGGTPQGVACALGHLLFNVLGTIVFWPLQFIPISLAKGFAKMASRRRLLAAFYILFVFFVVPIVAIVISYYIRN
ncbi:MAG: Na/Pi symporter [Phycisphaerae bacterium]